MKIFIFSHIADPDGIAPIILSKLAFNQVDYKLLENPIDNDFLDYINKHNFDEYNYIFMTDLCINERTAEKLDSKVKEKLLIFDHHISNNNMNKYDFISIIDEQNGIKESGTSLYYQYLIDNFNNELLNKEITKKLVNLTRLGDTWTWVKGEEECVYLADYLSMVGIEEYIDYFYNTIKNNQKELFNEKLYYLFEIEAKRKQIYISDMENQIIPCYIKPYHVGIIFAELYRSSLGNYLATKYENKYDFIIIINMSRSISLRGIKDIDLSEFAKIYGGKGHKKASGIPFPKDLKEKIIQEIFDGAIINGN